MLAKAFRIRPGHMNGMTFRIDFRTVHGGGDSTRRGNETLDLLGFPSLTPQPADQSGHVFFGAARKRAHQVRYNVLFFPGLMGFAGKPFTEFDEAFESWFPHQPEDVFRHVFRGQFQLTADEPGDKIPHKGRIPLRQIMPNAAGYPDMFDAGNFLEILQQMKVCPLGILEMGTRGRKQATDTSAFFAGGGTPGSPHVGRRSPDVADGAFPLIMAGHPRHFLQNTVGGSGLNYPSLMQCQGTE